ncbi:MAG: hypothetical protein HZB09_01465 [Candidatus Yonathbacteria bacterium]|nr:hypothetical protein [Candidatus Yonathbacteria bacterium]
MSTTGTVNAPQFGRGVSALQEARTRRENERKEVAKQKSSEEMLWQTLVVARRERRTRVENATQTITKLLNDGKFREAQEKTLSEIHWLLDELKLHADIQDRLWIAKKILHFTSWRGMRVLNDVEEVLTSVFGENIPDEIAKKLAQLIDKQTEFLRKSEAKKAGVMRFGKTKRDRESGALRQHESNKATKADQNRERAHGSNNGSKNSKK